MDNVLKSVDELVQFTCKRAFLLLMTQHFVRTVALIKGGGMGELTQALRDDPTGMGMASAFVAQAYENDPEEYKQLIRDTFHSLYYLQMPEEARKASEQDAEKNGSTLEADINGKMTDVVFEITPVLSSVIIMGVSNEETLNDIDSQIQFMTSMKEAYSDNIH